jgi:D-arabinose 1-dehydrogenase-like Zn-dependent alcohol dehydrogenase
MGFYTVALARGKEKESLALKLGAHLFIDSSIEDPAIQLQKIGGAHAILATASSGKSMSGLLNGLKPRGKLLVIGVAVDPMEILTPQIILGSKTIHGEVVGTAIDIEDTLKFSRLQQVRPMIELVPLEKAPEAYAKMMANKARFRMVLTMK